MHRSRAVPRVRLAAVAAGATLLLTGCDGGATDDGGRYPHETGARCATEADTPADCETAEDLAEEVEALAGVAAVEYEFRSIDGEGINELVLTILAADDATTDDLAAAITSARDRLPSVDGDRDTTLVVTQHDAALTIDDEEDPDVDEAAGLVLAAGTLGDAGFVAVSASPAEIWVNLAPESTNTDVVATARRVVTADLPPSVHVRISGGPSYLGGDALTEEDVTRFEAVVAALPPGAATASVSGRDVSVTIDGPADIRPRDFTLEAYGDRWWPMIRAHLGLVRAMGDGASYVLDTNWEQNEAGFDTIVDVAVGQTQKRSDPRGWDEAAEELVD